MDFDERSKSTEIVVELVSLVDACPTVSVQGVILCRAFAISCELDPGFHPPFKHLPAEPHVPMPFLPTK